MATALTSSMIRGLEYYARIAMGEEPAITDPVMRRPSIGTIVALIERGLLTPGTDHTLTKAGSREAQSYFKLYALWVHDNIRGIREIKKPRRDSDRLVTALNQTTDFLAYLHISYFDLLVIFGRPNANEYTLEGKARVHWVFDVENLTEDGWETVEVHDYEEIGRRIDIVRWHLRAANVPAAKFFLEDKGLQERYTPVDQYREDFGM